jgi:hypothetical protein
VMSSGLFVFWRGVWVGKEFTKYSRIAGAPSRILTILSCGSLKTGSISSSSLSSGWCLSELTNTLGL